VRERIVRASPPVVVGALVGAAVLALACGPKEPPLAPPAASPPTGRAATLVNATILANGCKDLGPAATRRAQRAMDQLVDGCTSVPGGRSQFEATLQPGGRIAISAVAGQPDVVPICILKHSLLHDVPLTKPCQLDVKIEETSISVVLDAGAG
jgi:hypothetical protein